MKKILIFVLLVFLIIFSSQIKAFGAYINKKVFEAENTEISGGASKVVEIGRASCRERV